MADDLKKIKQGLGLSESEIEAFAEQQERAQKKPLEAIKEVWEGLKKAFGVTSTTVEPQVDLTVYEARRRGRDFCQTDGAEHYQQDIIEPTDYIIAQGWANGFCKGNVTKYLARHDHTGNMEDLRKAADYLHILCGVMLAEEEER